MTYEYVDVGARPNDGTGDPLRTAYIKINNNFAQLQQFGTSKISNGTSNVNIPVANGNVNTTANGNLTLGVADRAVTVYGDLTVTGNATVSGNVTRNAISYGSSFLGFGAADGNANVTIAGVSNVAVFTTAGLNVNGTITGTTVSASGNVIGANVVGVNTVQGNNIVGTTVSATTVSASGNVIGANVVGVNTVQGNNIVGTTITGTTVSATGSVIGAIVSATGNVIGGNVIGANLSATGNVVGQGGVYANVTIDNQLSANTIIAQIINTSILSASGNVLGPIPSVSNTFYVAKNGSDSNNGGLNTPFLTIKQACTAAQAAGGNVAIRIASGTYVEQNPVTIPANTALMGDNLRTVQVKPATPSGDLFYMNGGTYVWGLTVRDYLGAAFSYNPSTVTTAYVSPYIQNITSYTTTGTGVRIDGSKAIGTKAMIVGFYTIINQGGIGIDISNSGYSQLVNIYTIGADIGIRTQSGAFCTLNGSDCSIGNYGLVSRGIGPLQTSGTTVGYSTGGRFVIDSLSSGQPHVNTVMFINDADYSTTSSDTLAIAVSVVSLTIGLGLSYSVGQTVIIQHDLTNYMTGTVQSYDSGTGVLGVDVTGILGSGTYNTWKVNLYPLRYYTIDTIIPNTPAAGNSTVIIQEVYTANLVPGTSVEFYTRSAIIASAHTFEYVGAGTNPATALPQYGGIPIAANEVVTSDGGVVTFTSTDQKGNFRVGKGFTVNQATGTVSGDDFYRSLFAIMTPYILALQEVP